MGSIKHLLANNSAWAEQTHREDPGFFTELAAGHRPKFLWIGCSDARVPANELLGLKPGEVFVHRNIGNQVPASDPNSLAVIQYAVETLNVTDIIVCGHYGCGGIWGALGRQSVGNYVEHWVHPIKDLYRRHQAEIDALPNPLHQANRLAELNARQQVLNVSQTSFVREAWERGIALAVHGLVYAIGDGLLHSLGHFISSQAELEVQMREMEAPIVPDDGSEIVAGDELAVGEDSAVRMEERAGVSPVLLVSLAGIGAPAGLTATGIPGK